MARSHVGLVQARIVQFQDAMTKLLKQALAGKPLNQFNVSVASMNWALLHDAGLITKGRPITPFGKVNTAEYKLNVHGVVASIGLAPLESGGRIP